MTSRTTYVARTPDVADFATSSFVPTPLPSVSTSGLRVVNTRWKELLSQASEIVASNAGLLLVAASQFFFSLMNLAVKKLNTIDPPVAALELIVVRMGITLICCIIYMFITEIPDPFLGPKGVRMLLFTRGFCGFFGLFGVYYSLQYLSLSDATVLTFLSPLTTAIAGALLLNESFTRKEAFSGVFSLFGVILIARPTFIFGSVTSTLNVSGNGDSLDVETGSPAERLGAVGIALVGVIGSTGAFTSLRAIGKRAHPLHSLVSFSTQCVIVASLCMLMQRTPVVVPVRVDFLLLLVMIGLFGFIAQTLLTLGLQRETAGRASLAIYLQIIFATILERMFFHYTPSILSVIGSLVILTSAIYVALTKTDAPGKAPNRGITLEGAEEAAMEEGLLEDIGLEEADTSHIKLGEKKCNQTMAESYPGDDVERRRTGKVAELVEDVRYVKLGT